MGRSLVPLQRCKAVAMTLSRTLMEVLLRQCGTLMLSKIETAIGTRNGGCETYHAVCQLVQMEPPLLGLGLHIKARSQLRLLWTTG